MHPILITQRAPSSVATQARAERHPRYRPSAKQTASEWLCWSLMTCWYIAISCIGYFAFGLTDEKLGILIYYSTLVPLFLTAAYAVAWRAYSNRRTEKQKQNQIQTHNIEEQ